MAYTYRIEDDFRTGISQTAFLNGAGPFRGIACHWTAGVPGYNGAKGTATYLASDAGRLRNASYHEIWWWENKTFGVLRIVRPDRAAHSMNPTPPTWAPDELVKRILGDKVGDPNRYSYAVSFAGMPADLKTACADPDFVVAATRRMTELYQQFSSLAVDPLFNHGEGQPSTRYDWGTELRPAIYKYIGEENMAWIDTFTPVINRRYYIKAGATARTTPAFNASNPDGNKIVTHTSGHWRTVSGIVRGTALIGPNGEVYNSDDRWFMAIRSDGDGGIFYHIQDKEKEAAIESVTVTDPTLQQKIDDQAEIIATQKTEIATLTGRIAKKNTKADELKAI